MNVYQKLAKARLDFQGIGIKKSGKNNYAGYEYYELADILPEINKIGSDIGFVCEVSFTADLGSLIFRDSEKPEDFILFTSPMSEAALKGCHAVQNLGAVETYIKRYLYQNAFEIVEHDALDKTMGKPEPKKDAPNENEYVKLKGELIDYINAGLFAHPENVEAVIEKKDIAQMRKAKEAAQAKEKKNAEEQ